MPSIRNSMLRNTIDGLSVLGGIVWILSGLLFILTRVGGLNLAVFELYVSHFYLVHLFSVLCLAAYLDPIRMNPSRKESDNLRMFSSQSLFINGVVAVFGALAFVRIFDPSLHVGFDQLLFVVNGLLTLYVMYDLFFVECRWNPFGR